MSSEWSEALLQEHKNVTEAVKHNDGVASTSTRSGSFDLDADAAINSSSTAERHLSANLSSVRTHSHTNNMPSSAPRRRSYTNRSPVRSHTNGISTGNSTWSSSRTGSAEELIEHHERVWAILPTLEELHWSDFPWPVLKRPLSAEDITYADISAYVHSQNHPDKDKPVKDRIKDYIRRWHPDRVETKLLPRVVEEDKEKVKEGAGMVARNLNQLFNSLGISLFGNAVTKGDIALDDGHSASQAGSTVNDRGATSITNSAWRSPMDIPRPISSASHAASQRELARASQSRSSVIPARRNSTASLQSNESPYRRLVRRTSATSLQTKGAPDYSCSNPRPAMLSHQSSFTREERRYDDVSTSRKPSATPEADFETSRPFLTPPRRNSTASLQSNESSSNPYRRARPMLSRQPSFTREEEKRRYENDFTSRARANSIPERNSSQSPARAIPTLRKPTATPDEEATTSRSSLTHIRRNSTASQQSNESSYDPYRRASPVLSRRSSYTKEGERRRYNEVESPHEYVRERKRTSTLRRVASKPILNSESARPSALRSRRDHVSDDEYDEKMYENHTYRRHPSLEEMPDASYSHSRSRLSRQSSYKREEGMRRNDSDYSRHLYASPPSNSIYVPRISPSIDLDLVDYDSDWDSELHQLEEKQIWDTLKKIAAEVHMKDSGAQNKTIGNRRKELEMKRSATEARLWEAENHAKAAEQKLMEQKAREKEEELRRRAEVIEQMEEAVRQREEAMMKMENALRQKADAVKQREEEVRLKAEEVYRMEETVTRKEREVRLAEEDMKGKTDQIKEREEELMTKEGEARQKEEVLVHKEQWLQLWEDRLVHQEEKLKWYTDARNILTDVCSNKTKCEQLLTLDETDLQLVLDLMQMVLEHSCTRACDLENLLLKAMLRISKRHTLCPRSYILSGIERGEYAIASGHFGEVFQGEYKGHKVSLKVFKLYSSEMSKLNQFIMAFYKEAILWRHLTHCNLLPFYGIYQLGDSGKRICLVSPWMNEGNIIQYLERNPRANRRYLTLDIARGVSYLHQKSIVHGDLKGVNVLVSDAGVACLADFGLSSVILNTPGVWSESSTVSTAGTVRWQAPELIGGGDDSFAGRTKESDVYAFACVCYEVFVGKIPFYEILNDVTVMHKVMILGQRPLRPEVDSDPHTQWGLTDWMWSLIEECWSQVAAARPLAADVVAKLSSRNEYLRDGGDGHGDWGDLLPEMFRSLIHQQPTLLKDDIQRCIALLNDL